MTKEFIGKCVTIKSNSVTKEKYGIVYKDGADKKTQTFLVHITSNEFKETGKTVCLKPECIVIDHDLFKTF